MLRNENNTETDLQEEDCFSLCSSCKSDLRVIFSLGVPSYLDTSVSSSISSHPCDTSSQASEMTNVIKTMQPLPALDQERSGAFVHLATDRSERLKLSKDARKDESLNLPKRSVDRANYSNANCSAEERDRAERNRNAAVTNVTSLQACKRQRLDDAACTQMHGFINPRNRVGIQNLDDSQNAKGIGEMPKSSDCPTSRGIDTSNNYALEIQSSGRGAFIVDNLRDNANNQTMIASKAPKVVDPPCARREAVDVSLVDRRRNVYKLAMGILKCRFGIYK